MLRLLGLQALASLASTLPPRAARSATLVVLVLANATPLWAVATGRWGAGDVLVVFWLENLAVGFWTLVRMATTAGADPLDDRTGEVVAALDGARVAVRGADGRSLRVPMLLVRLGLMGFFCFHYGMFTVVHGVFTFLLAHRIGTTGSVGGYLLVLLVLLASHGVSTAVHWFWRGGRYDTGLMRAMQQPYGRIVLLHVVILGSAFLIARDGGELAGGATVTGTTAVLPAVALVALKTLLDAGLHLRAHRSLEAPAPLTVPVA